MKAGRMLHLESSSGDLRCMQQGQEQSGRKLDDQEMN